MNDIVLKGAAGELRWGYHVAASLSTWEVSRQTLTAKVVSHDPFRVSQQPVTFVVPRPKGRDWSWKITSLQITGTTLTALIAE